jgi:hypothetical protein
MRLRRYLVLLPALALVAGCSTAAMGTLSATPPPAVLSPPTTSPKAVLFSFDDRALSPTRISAARPAVTVVTLSAGGARPKFVGGASGLGLSTPSHAATAAGGRLVLAIRPVSAADPLSPGSRSFDFGADVLLDGQSSGSTNDNGDNVLQRGLYADFSQFKLQVDKGVPSCLIKSGSIRLFVKSEQRLKSGWHRVRCSYVSGKLSVSVAGLSGIKVGTTRMNSVTGSVKPLSFDPKTPMTVGGKVAPSGKIVVKNSDQFNGMLDNVFIDVR